MPPIYVSKDGKRHGPYSLKQLDQLLQTETFTGDDLYWHEGAADWRPISQLPGYVAPPGAAEAALAALPRPSFADLEPPASTTTSRPAEPRTEKAAKPAPPAPSDADSAAKKVKDDYVKYLRATSTYPTFRSLMGIFVLLIYLLGGLWIVGGLVAGVVSITKGVEEGLVNGIGLMLAGLIAGCFYIVIGKVVKEIAMMAADIADTLLNHHSQGRK